MKEKCVELDNTSDCDTWYIEQCIRLDKWIELFWSNACRHFMICLLCTFLDIVQQEESGCFAGSIK